MSTVTASTVRSDEPRFDLPQTDDHTEKWWQALNDGRLLLEHCVPCGHLYFYPRGMCPACWSEEVEWVRASGRGRVYTYSVVHMNDLPPFRNRLPYVVAMVDLEEGPRITANLDGVDTTAVEIGLLVTLRPRRLDERYSAPEFVPAVTE
jgi:uncharacterized OB-fold protein